MTPLVSAGARPWNFRRARRSAAVLAALILSLLPSRAAPTTWTVTPAGPMTIQDAVDAANAYGDTILLGPGTYTGPGNRDVSAGSKQIVIKSAAGADVTIIDCENGGRAFLLTDLADGATAVTGLTILNGRLASGHHGGAILVQNGAPTASVLLKDNVFENNRTTGHYDLGGAVAVLNVACIIEGNVFDSDSSLYAGGALSVAGADVTIEDNQFIDNSASFCSLETELCNGRGGAVSVTNSRGLVTGNDFRRNNGSEWGGAIHSVNNTLTVRGNIFEDNRSLGWPWTQGGGGAIHLTDGAVTIEENLFISNIANCGGGGAVFVGPGDHTVTGNTFFQNHERCAGGSAILVMDGSPVIEACVFAFNTGSNPHSVVGCRGTSAPAIACCDFFGNDPDDGVGYYCSGTVGDTINRDPMFCDAEAGDFAIDGASPCAADNNTCGVLMGAFPPACGTTPVFITGFDARAQASGVRLWWTLYGYEDVVEVRVYRTAGGGSEELLIGRVQDVGVRELVDDDVSPGEEYAYTIAVLTDDGTVVRSDAVRVRIPLASMRLYQNQPNPFASATTIRFVLDAEREVDLAVFDVSGRRVATLVSGLLPAGEHEYRWGDSKSLDRISSGIYFCRLEADGRVFSRKMMFVR